MRLEHYSYIADEECMIGMLRLMAGCDREFVPRLSERSSTDQRELLPGAPVRIAGLMAYYKHLLSQSVIAAYSDDGTLAGFLSYRPDFRSDDVPLPDDRRADYVTTVIVDPALRRRGTARLMYRKLLRDNGPSFIYTRTWSTNSGHIGLLSRLGFIPLLELRDDRGAGVSTAYFGRDGDG